MKTDEPFDYLAAIVQLQQQKNIAPLQDPDYIPPQPDSPVDYLSISKAWERAQTGKNIIHLHTRKRNPSHDPE